MKELFNKYRILLDHLNTDRDLKKLMSVVAVENRFSYADLLLFSGYYEEAITEYQGYISKHNDPEILQIIYFNLSEAYKNMGKKREASKYFDLSQKKE